MKQITEGELYQVLDTLNRMYDELEGIEQSTSDYVTTTGIEDSLRESLIIVESLLEIG